MLVGLLLFALTLRGPFVVVSTVTDELNSQLGMSATTIGLLTSLPVLCFGLAAPGASVLIARLGVERSVLASLLGTFVGVLIRSVGGVPGALIGTLIIGLAITVGNVVSPVIIGRDFYGRAATVTGVYTGALNVGTMLTLTATGPLVTRFGWQIALAAWAVLPVIAAVVWVPLAQRRAAARARQKAAPSAHGNRPADSPPPARLTTLLRRPSTWLLTGAFAGQAFAYYGLTAWLPTLLADEQGMNRDQASASSSIFQICALIGALGAPIIINRLGGPLSAFLIFGALWSTMPLGPVVRLRSLGPLERAVRRGPGRRVRRSVHRRRPARGDPAGEPPALGDRADRRVRGGQPRSGDPRCAEREHRRLGCVPAGGTAGHLRPDHAWIAVHQGTAPLTRTALSSV